jgi:hypothetical protein
MSKRCEKGIKEQTKREIKKQKYKKCDEQIYLEGTFCLPQLPSVTVTTQSRQSAYLTERYSVLYIEIYSLRAKRSDLKLTGSFAGRE